MVATDVPLAPLGRREQKKLETRRAIKDAALRVACERGVEGLTVEAIADAADVAPRTFFNYFACKEDALVVEAAEGAVQLHRLIVNRPADEAPLRALRVVITESELVAAAHADRERVLARQKLIQDHPPLMSRQLAQYWSMERTFAEALAERLDVDPDRDLRPALAAALATSVMRMVMRRWTAEEQQPLTELIDTAFDLLEHGDVVTAPGHTTP